MLVSAFAALLTSMLRCLPLLLCIVTSLRVYLPHCPSCCRLKVSQHRMRPEVYRRSVSGKAKASRALYNAHV
jgi:hypothetical protein